MISKKARALTHYEVLRLPPASSAEQLHRRYLEIAFSCHPDRGGDEKKFQALTEAWGVLKDRASRARYDAQLKLSGEQCPTCEGSGLKWTFAERKEVICKACGGTGQREVPR